MQAIQTKGKVNILSRVDFIRLATTDMAQAVIFLTYDTTDERTTKSRNALLDYLSDIGMNIEAQAIEAHKSIILFEFASDAVRAWQQINDHSHAVAAHVFWHGLQDDAVHEAILAAKPKMVSPLIHP
ncbi:MULTISPECIES: hypothetical protein [Deefgea]|uniref:hypothetical protein n=1 Tax=Deefgea TaxID=400947 RepID=UPI0015F78344|nr:MULTISPECIES: hypothetical protein [Deefgea]MBM5574318.1 hypothetical protein [Deefgea sp. CFH1-16]QZA81424.1 hypothetical protein K4H25_01785 [Deefgea piscis]